MKEKAVQDMENITAKLKYPREKWHIVEGDITQPNLALSAEQTEELAQSVTHVFHLAAIKGILSIPAIRKRLGTEKEALDYFECMAVYDATEAQTVLQKAGISCPDFRDVIPVMVRYYREHKHDKTKQIPIR
ncbi:hypothetical protein BDD39_001086 [Saccharococcus thermophilus]|uniref:Thioester reductase (TE) domain-containing protein n=2 Tax=Saccharococcus thermophilus TaxID=29396 RepID=A0A846MAL3_9BACL|nr:hypothetical protein [Saccharococcus thermophilus]